MSKNTKLLLWLGGLGSMVVLSIMTYRYITTQIELLQSSCYKFKNLKILSLKKKRIAMTMTMYVKNISKIAFFLKNYNFDIIINGKKVANVNKKLNQHISANGGISEVKIDIEFNPKVSFNALDIISLLKYALLEKDKFIIKLKGFVDVKHSIIETKQDIEIDFTLKEILEDDEDATSTNTAHECKIEI